MTTLRAIITAADREQQIADRTRRMQYAAEPTWLRLALWTWGTFAFVLCAIYLAVVVRDPAITFRAWRLVECSGLALVFSAFITALAWLEWTAEQGRGTRG